MLLRLLFGLRTDTRRLQQLHDLYDIGFTRFGRGKRAIQRSTQWASVRLRKHDRQALLLAAQIGSGGLAGDYRVAP